MLGFDVIAPIYVQQPFKSACCTSPEHFHEKCYCTAGISFCKAICDEDVHCKGYVGEGEQLCQIATTSNCPESAECEKTSLGKNQELDRFAKCGSGNVEGCFIKQQGNLSQPNVIAKYSLLYFISIWIDQLKLTLILIKLIVSGVCGSCKKNVM